MAEKNPQVEKLLHNINRSFYGDLLISKLAVTCLLARGHLLIEDIPGVGKTTLAKSLATSLGLSCKRIQFTSDLLPTDITGVNYYDRGKSVFEFKKGPIFSNIVLADEINRTSPKTQSALLEAMQEGSVTVENNSYKLPEPFFVIATQNPLEHFGTFPLPESQIDRFLLNLSIGYPPVELEKKIIRNKALFEASEEGQKGVLTLEEILEMQKTASKVFFHEDLIDYLIQLIQKTRNHAEIWLGISSRGAIAAYKAAQAFAFINNRDFVTIDDLKILIPYVFSHRLLFKKSSQNGLSTKGKTEAILKEITESVNVPR